jgi:hypothetical protein
MILWQFFFFRVSRCEERHSRNAVEAAFRYFIRIDKAGR